MAPDPHQPLIDALQAKRAEVQATMASLEQSDQPVALDQTLQGRLSRIDAMTQQQMAKAGHARLATELTRIDAALARAAQGRYGTCCRCPEALEPARLAADPAAPFCLDCVEELAEEKRIEAQRDARR